MKRTEYKLKLWREGQTNAERFAADLLLLDGFSSVSPQSPLGGPDGLTQELKDASDEILSLSGMTFIHEMARLFLIEQIYRAQKIIRGANYHR